MMVDKGGLASDPRGLIFEAYRMDGVGPEECRAIFFDWALGTPLGADMRVMLQEFLTVYGDAAPDHPMTAVLREGLEKARDPKRRGGRSRRR